MVIWGTIWKMHCIELFWTNFCIGLNCIYSYLSLIHLAYFLFFTSYIRPKGVPLMPLSQVWYRANKKDIDFKWMMLNSRKEWTCFKGLCLQEMLILHDIQKKINQTYFGCYALSPHLIYHELGTQRPNV